MPKRVRKPEANLPPSGRVHAARNIPDDVVRFSFKHFERTDKFCCQLGDEAYFPTLLERLKNLCSLRPGELHSNGSKALRCHGIDWSDTTEPDGFSHLNEQLQEIKPMQFQITANAHGRVHGFMIDEVFYIVWLDPNHALYARP